MRMNKLEDLPLRIDKHSIKTYEAPCPTFDCGKKRWVDRSKINALCFTCAHRARRIPREPCIVCGKDRATDFKLYCSRECRSVGTARVERTCLTCGETFKLRAHALPPINRTTNARGKYCSKPCYTEAQRGFRFGEFEPEA
jgi:hypothetical protein